MTAIHANPNGSRKGNAELGADGKTDMDAEGELQLVEERAVVEEAGFVWESRYTQSWEILKEDDAGTLQPTLAVMVQRESEYLQRRRATADAALRRGILRHVAILLDWSQAAAASDVPPNRAVWCVALAVRPFVREFFEQNPLSQLALIVLCDGVASKISDLSANLVDHEAALDRLVAGAASPESAPRGDLSLQNGLEVARSILSHIPGHGTREALLLQIALSSVDPGSIFDLIPALVSAKIRVSVVSCSAEIAVARRLTRSTGGSYGVALNDAHFSDLAKEHLTPPAIASKDSRAASFLVKMGFPSQVVESRPSLCVCHGRLVTKTFRCPRCRARLCQLPMDCVLCQLTLISAPHLAKSYHHLFPVANYVQDALAAASLCFACGRPSDPTHMHSGYYSGRCSRCCQEFCAPCNHFVHNVLYNCPGCLCV